MLFIKNPFNIYRDNSDLRGKYSGFRSINEKGDLRTIYELKVSDFAYFVDINNHGNLILVIMAKAKKRLDEILVKREFVDNIEEARQLAMEGFAIVDGQKSVSGAQLFPPDVGIRLRKRKKFVGRGALKLQAALEVFDINIKDKICVDIGAATGGFTEVLLNHGASKVYAIDTTYGKLADKLREDLRVVVMERTDARDTVLPDLPDGGPTIAVMDISLIPLKDILPTTRILLKNGGDIICLLKPQYEIRDPRILHHGIVSDKNDQNRILQEFIDWANENDYKVLNYMTSPIKGRSGGNREFLLHLRIVIEL